jgi:cyclopropane-fatty-acyl-phospholipid synthase
MELEAAQREKLAVIFKALELAPGHSLLEIGCGWGTIAEAAAHAGASVRAITISEQQRRAAIARIAASELSHRAEVVFEDYRQTSGQFDRIVSVEMIEAVGEENWSAYFDVIARRMRPDAVAVIQAITIREDAFARYRANPDFIQRYIFPGGMLPTVEVMKDCAGRSGLQFETVERFGASYVATLSDWRQRFLAAWPAIEALGFDERFKRMWLYYLDYCTIGFKRGWIDVGLYRMRRSDVAPALRDDGEARGG